MQPPKEHFPTRIMVISLIVSLVLIIISCVILERTWRQSAFGAPLPAAGQP